MSQTVCTSDGQAGPELPLLLVLSLVPSDLAASLLEKSPGSITWPKVAVKVCLDKLSMSFDTCSTHQQLQTHVCGAAAQQTLTQHGQ